MREAWDDAKNRSHRAKHGVDVANAKPVFAGRCVTCVDDRVDSGARRLVSLGTLAGRLVVIAHSPRGQDTTHIISIRKANRREQNISHKRLHAT